MTPKLMNRTAVAIALAALAATARVHAADILTGDARSACEAILCLSSSTRPSECSPSLQRYFGITRRRLSDTINARRAFLQQCPAAGSDSRMQSLVQAISEGAGRCDAASLNATLATWVGSADGGYYLIADTLPPYCASYTGNAYTDLRPAVYVGTPGVDGRWIE